MPVRTRGSHKASHPTQRELRLEAPPADLPQTSLPSTREVSSLPGIVSGEVLFSRLLAGSIDLLLPAFTGLLFTFAAASLLNFDFFSMASMNFILVFSFCFYLLNSLFFLLLAGQTPGMYLTDLQLLPEKPGEIGPWPILVRVLIFLPVLATGVGLLWSIFDSSRRCLHDLISGTCVLPISEDE